ncbi:MAG TPA: hypothetical protein VM370_10885 [Candidatus Thermoplasmatota archaeon]|nr:hypothetical protein [Candidatus Thermoplasmatota archaeon]
MPALSAAASNRVINGDFETVGDDPTIVPGWTDDHCNQGRLRCTLQLQGIGEAQSVGLLVVGPELRRSAQLFGVTAGTAVTLDYDVWEVRDDCGDGVVAVLCGEPASSRGIVRGDSVVSIEFVDGLTGKAPVLPTTATFPQTVAEFETHCDAYVDIVDNGAIDGSDTCDTLDTYVHVTARNSSGDFECRESVDAAGAPTNPGCTNYDGVICNATDPLALDSDCIGSANLGGCLCIGPTDNSLLAPTDSARVLVGGSLALDPIDALLFGFLLDDPLSVTAFDNIDVEN